MTSGAKIPRSQPTSPGPRGGGEGGLDEVGVARGGFNVFNLIPRVLVRHGTPPRGSRSVSPGEFCIVHPSGVQVSLPRNARRGSAAGDRSSPLQFHFSKSELRIFLFSSCPRSPPPREPYSSRVSSTWGWVFLFFPRAPASRRAPSPRLFDYRSDSGGLSSTAFVKFGTNEIASLWILERVWLFRGIGTIIPNIPFYWTRCNCG